MAVDVCAEVPGSAAISPRISFSHDLNPTAAAVAAAAAVDRRADVSSSSDFDFCITKNFSMLDFSTADELFSNGKILPTEANKSRSRPPPSELSPRLETSPPPLPPPPPPPPPPTAASVAAALSEKSEKKKLKELLVTSPDENDNPSPSPLPPPLSSSSPLKSLWQFGRSASLNCESNRGRTLIRSLQFLSRSNSTGSALNPKQTAHGHKDGNPNRHLRKQSSASSSFSRSSRAAAHQKPPLKKSCRAHGGDGVRISPVLNLPPQYISKATAGLFGLGSLLCNCNGNGKDRKKKKK